VSTPSHITQEPDVVVRLRNQALGAEAGERGAHWTSPTLLREAADEIETLRACNSHDDLVAALQDWERMSLVIESAMRSQTERDSRSLDQYATIVGLIAETRSALSRATGGTE